VDDFGDSHPGIDLTPDFVDYDAATDTLKVQIAAGDPPDIVGPMNVRASHDFRGMFLDLEPLVEDTGYDLSDFDPAVVDFWRLDGEGLVGLPFTVYPSFLYYNRDLFDQADLDYPPHRYGEPYADGDEWTLAKLQEIAIRLTVDSRGYDTDSGEFNPDGIAQFGFIVQWSDPKGVATLCGPGNFVDEDGNAVCPPHWQEAFRWYYDAMWDKWFVPNGEYTSSDIIEYGNAFNSGVLGMVHCHLWYLCCLLDVENWDIAATPSYGEQTTCKLHAETFRILDDTGYPREAFEAVSYLTDEAAPELMEVYGSMPARESLQADYFAEQDERFPGTDWQVAIDSLSYADIPSHEAYMPNPELAYDRIYAFQNLYENEPNLDIDEAIDELLADLQEIFDKAQ
jgi:multiple sugar transport system substrate-binding protein